MSSRHIRKLQQQRELEESAKRPAATEEDESEDELVAAPKPKPSFFASLAALEGADEDDEREEEEEERAEVNEKEQISNSATKKPKKAKKKKKKSARGKNAESMTSDVHPLHENGPDEIDEALQALNIHKPAKGTTEKPVKASFDPEYERICTLLGISSQHLKVANEMRNLFGRTALENHDDAGGAVPRAGRRRQRGQPQQVDLETALRGHHPPGKGLPELLLRRNNFIQGKDEWPKGTTGGLTMAVVDDQRKQDGTVEFRYVHGSLYQSVQAVFHTCVEIGDPQNLIGLLTRNPYHISLLVQVSKIAKDQSDHALSADLLERALFTFGRASSSLFNTQLAAGKARLDFARPENRELWLAGYQYIRSLVMKGTYRTALEWAKLLLSIDPEGDPYCVGRLLVHHLAIRANEFNWLLRLASTELPQHWSNPGHVSHAFDHMRPSLAYAAMKLHDGKKSRELLSESMQIVPWLFTSLFKELNLDAPPSIWGIEPRSDAEILFTAIYIQQCKDLWNTPEATALLMEVAHTIPRLKVEALPTPTPHGAMTLDVVRFVYLDGNPSIMRFAPSELLHRSNNSDADPLPPDINIFSYEVQREAVQPRGAVDAIQDDHWNPLAAIGRLLPGFMGRNREADTDDDDFDEGFRLREELEAVLARAEEDSSEDDEDVESQEGIMPVSVARRLINMIWRPSRASEEGDLDEGEDGIATDTDDEMPGLVDEGMPGPVESDDDMPALVRER